uniref:Uncharacterized protein LOC104234667 isoform X2 n=1 Tax=Nicotiana sylvestris TaxID=4096 RepID=A0A1U7X369_NICSY|nr:PREDICTED: uncharacterized protein LOC104234667 isoform X2 [Nicotiana sylvestris]
MALFFNRVLTCLKVLIQQRAQKIGHESLANNFDLKTIRALNETFSNMGIEQLSSYICSDKRKKMMEMFFEELSPNGKQRASSYSSRSKF